MRLLAYVAFLLSTVYLSAAAGGGAHMTAEEWTTDRKVSLVVAEVSSVERRDGTTSDYSLSIVPIATLAGPLDATKLTSISTSFIYHEPVGGFQVTAIKGVPAVGKLILVVLREWDDRYLVVAGSVDLMPDSSPLTVLSGLDDPAIRVTIEKLRTIRAAKSKD